MWEDDWIHLGQDRDQWLAGEDCIMRSFITCRFQQMLLGCASQGWWDGRDM